MGLVGERVRVRVRVRGRVRVRVRVRVVDGADRLLLPGGGLGGARALATGIAATHVAAAPHAAPAPSVPAHLHSLHGLWLG